MTSEKFSSLSQKYRKSRTIRLLRFLGIRRVDKLLSDLAALEQLEYLPDEDLFTRIRCGESFAVAATSVVKRLIGNRRQLDARAFAASLCMRPETKEVGRLCYAICCYPELPDAAVQAIRGVDETLATQTIPVEYIAIQLSASVETASSKFLRWPDEISAGLSPDHCLEIAEQFAGYGQYSIAMKLVEQVSRKVTAKTREDLLQRSEWLQTQLKRMHQKRGLVQPSTVYFGLLDYKSLDFQHSSRNLGDPIQTLAAFAHLLRFAKVTFTSEDDLADLARDLTERIEPRDRLISPNICVELIPVDRDYASGAALTCPTWLIVAGWFMASHFGIRFDFPFPSSIRPLFISFHINDPKMLTPDAVAYLNRYAPIGCRDWSTVYLLRQKGVSAFFSGCITTTIDLLFPHSTRPLTSHLAVDTRATSSSAFLSQVDPGMPHRNLTTNLQAAFRQLDQFQRSKTIVTSRLHCYLPSLAMGVNAGFAPRNPGDRRYDGLVGISPPAIKAMGKEISRKLELILQLVLSEASEEVVYTEWRKICADDVKLAERYCTEPISSIEIEDDPTLLANEVRAQSKMRNLLPDTIEVSLAADKNHLENLGVVIESILANTNSPVNFSLLLRKIDQSEANRIADIYPQAGFRFFILDGVNYGNAKLLSHTTQSTMDRLLLPELLPAVERLIYLDTDVLVLADLKELWSFDFAGCPLAAVSSVHPAWANGHGLSKMVTRKMPTSMAADFRRRVETRENLDFRSFNAGVLILDLACMRKNASVQRMYEYAAYYRMNDNHALAFWAGKNRAELPMEWNFFPHQRPVGDPKIVHWAGPTKPWQEAYCFFKEQWLDYRCRYRDRLNTNSNTEIPDDKVFLISTN